MYLILLYCSFKEAEIVNLILYAFCQSYKNNMRKTNILSVITHNTNTGKFFSEDVKRMSNFKRKL